MCRGDEFFKFIACEDEDRKPVRAEDRAQGRQGPCLGKGFAAGERDSFDAFDIENLGREIGDSAYVTSLERPCVGVPAAGAAERAPLDPQDESFARAVDDAATESASNVQAHRQ